jgi:outer membrane autotransporter protein
MTRLSLDGFGERNLVGASTPGILAMRYDAKKVTQFRSSLGFEVAGNYEMGSGMAFLPSIKASWVHTFDPERSLTAAFAAAPDFSFENAGMPAVANMARVEARASIRSNRFEWIARVGASVAAHYRAAQAQIGFRLGL